MTISAEPTTEPGTARDALANPDFRRIFLASFVSSTGRWMQGVVLGAFAYKLTGTAAFTTLVIAVQFFPLLALSLLGGSLADTVDRRHLLIVTTLWQTFWSLILAWQVADGTIGKPVLLGIVFMIGVGQALYAPAFTSVVPTLVGKANLSAAISLNSASVNGSRVIGPAIGGWMASRWGITDVFVFNALTYLLVVWALYVTPIPRILPRAGQTRSDRLLGGIRIAQRSPQVGRPLMIMITFSLFCLPFIGLMPAIAERSWGVDAQSKTYGYLYASFGLGALIGAASVGTFLLRVPKVLVIRGSMALFAVALAVLATLRSPGPVYVVLFFVGLFYFTMPTALSTYLQEHLGDEVRGRVMALWVISFGGFVAINNIFSGMIADATSETAVLLFGAAVAAALALAIRLEPGRIATEDLLTGPSPSGP